MRSEGQPPPHRESRPRRHGPGDAHFPDPPARGSRVPADRELLEPHTAGRVLRSLVTVRAFPGERRDPLGPVQVAWLQTAGVTRAFRAGAPVTAPAGREPALIVLTSGSVSVGRDVGGRRVLTEIVAARAVLTAGAANEVVALVPTEVVILPPEGLRWLVSRRPATAHAIAASLQARLDAGAADRAAAARLATLQRVARILLRLADRHGQPVSEGVAIDLPLTQQDVADLACASGKATATALQRLRAEGAVLTARRQIVLSDRDTVARFAQPDG